MDTAQHLVNFALDIATLIDEGMRGRDFELFEYNPTYVTTQALLFSEAETRARVDRAQCHLVLVL